MIFKYAFVFIILFAHITLLDLFFITLNGPVFLIKENLRIETITVHFVIALAAIIVCFLLALLRGAYKKGKLQLRNNLLMVSSSLLVFLIYFVLFKT